MKKIIVEFQDGRIIPAILNDIEELQLFFCRGWRKVRMDMDPSHLAKIQFTRFKDLKFWDRVRLLFWRDHYPDSPEIPVDPIERFFDYLGAFRQ